MDLFIVKCVTALQCLQSSTTDPGTEWWLYCNNVKEMHKGKIMHFKIFQLYLIEIWDNQFANKLLGVKLETESNFSWVTMDFAKLQIPQLQWVTVPLS